MSDLLDVVDQRRPDPNGEVRKGFEKHWKTLTDLTKIAGAANENDFAVRLMELPPVKMFAYISYCQGVDDMSGSVHAVLKNYPEMLAIFEKHANKGEACSTETAP